MSSTKSLGGFLSNNIGWTFNFVAIQALFWAAAFPVVLEHGYSNDSYDDDGGLPSGGDGSGIFIICVFLCVLTTIIYIKQMVDYFGGKGESDENTE